MDLEQFAGITAALDEGISLEAVLAQELVEASVWPRALRAWREALAGSTELQMEYLRRRQEAEDCLFRRTDPLGDDPVAWAGLLGALATAGNQAAVLRSLGLRASDIGRLGRLWKKRAGEDQEVVKRLSRAAGAAPPMQVECGPVELRPFPWTPKSELRHALLPSDGPPPIETNLTLFAALSAAIELPARRALALLLVGLDEPRLSAVVSAWKVRLTEPEVRARFTMLVGEYRVSLRTHRS